MHESVAKRIEENNVSEKVENKRTTNSRFIDMHLWIDPKFFLSHFRFDFD